MNKPNFNIEVEDDDIRLVVRVTDDHGCGPSFIGWPYKRERSVHLANLMRAAMNWIESKVGKLSA